MVKTFAVLSGTLVTNIIVAKTEADALAVAEGVVAEYTADNPSQIGWIYDETTNTFIHPTPQDETAAE